MMCLKIFSHRGHRALREKQNLNCVNVFGRLVERLMMSATVINKSFFKTKVFSVHSVSSVAKKGYSS